MAHQLGMDVLEHGALGRQGDSRVERGLRRDRHSRPAQAPQISAEQVGEGLNIGTRQIAMLMPRQQLVQAGRFGLILGKAHGHSAGIKQVV